MNATARPLLPPPLESTGRRAAWWWVAVLVVAGIAALVARGFDNPSVAASSATSTVSHRTDDPAPPSTVASSAARPPVSDEPGSSRLPVTSPSPDDESPAVDWPDVRAPRAGSYTYHATVDGDPGPASLVVRDLGAGLMTERLTVGESVIQRTLRWRARRAALLDMYSRAGSCAYKPTPTVLLLPLRRKSSWRAVATCRGKAGAVELSESVRVTGRAVVRVDGAAVPVWVIQRSSTSTARSATATVVSETRTTDLFAPELGLVVYQTGRSASPDSNGDIVERTWTLELVSTTSVS